MKEKLKENMNNKSKQTKIEKKTVEMKKTRKQSIHKRNRQTKHEKQREKNTQRNKHDKTRENIINLHFNPFYLYKLSF